MTMSTIATTTARYNCCFVSWLVLFLLLGTCVIISGEEHKHSNVIDDNHHHGDHEHEKLHHAAAGLDRHHHNEVDESDVNHHDHSEHIHDEDCNHDHDNDNDHDRVPAEAVEDKNTPDAVEGVESDVTHDHSEHIHDETCNHDHDRGAAEGTENENTPDNVEQKSSQHNHGHSHAGHDHSHNHSHRPTRPKPKFTPLMEAIRDDDMDAFQELISDSSTDMNQNINEWPNTALLYTFVQKKYGFTLGLLENGVDVRAKNGEGISPLLLAFKTVQDDALKMEIVNALEDAGADADEDILEEYLEEYRELMQHGGKRKGDKTNETVKEEL